MPGDEPPELPPSGWYRDPNTGNWRWWDGQQWTNEIRREAGAGWREWILTSPVSLRINRWVRDAAAVGLTVAFGLVLYTVATGRAVSGVGLLVVPAIPALIFGQFWVIAVVTGRVPKPTGGWRIRMKKRQRGSFNLLFGGLSTLTVYVLMALFFLGWLAGVTAFASSPAGNPTRGHAGCPYALNEHGSIECVSRSTYERARTQGQRGAAGVMSGFFVFHFGASASELNRRRGHGSSPAAPEPE
jgi:hypothetical protein